MIMKGKIARCFERLQTLDIKPTKDNMEKLLQSLYDLQEVYEKIGEQEGENGGSAADTE